MWQGLFFNKVTRWKMPQNSRKNTCAYVSILIKLQAEGTISTSNRWYTCIFYCVTDNTSQDFCTTCSVLLPITWKSSNCLFTANIIWDKVFKNEPSKICRSQLIKKLKWYGLLKDHILLNFLMAVFHKFYLFQFWILLYLMSGVVVMRQGSLLKVVEVDGFSSSIWSSI